MLCIGPRIQPFDFEKDSKSARKMRENATFTARQAEEKWFCRSSLVTSICDPLLQSNFHSIYCNGAPKSGKSTLLHLIGHVLSMRGFIVYFKSAEEVEKLDDFLLTELEVQSKAHPCALLIDDADAGDYSSIIWSALFVDQIACGITNLRILGVGNRCSPSNHYVETRSIANFDKDEQLWK